MQFDREGFGQLAPAIGANRGRYVKQKRNAVKYAEEPDDDLMLPDDAEIIDAQAGEGTRDSSPAVSSGEGQDKPSCQKAWCFYVGGGFRGVREVQIIDKPAVNSKLRIQ